MRGTLQMLASNAIRRDALSANTADSSHAEPRGGSALFVVEDWATHDATQLLGVGMQHRPGVR